MTSKININESHLALISRRTAVTSSRHSPSKISYESVASVIHECVCSACEAEFIAVVLRIASDHVSSFRGIERLTNLIRPEFRNLIPAGSAAGLVPSSRQRTEPRSCSAR